MMKQDGDERDMPVLANACLLLTSLAGAALLLWWTKEFHRDNRQMWMVPFGLVLTGTPIVVSFAVFASNMWRRVELLLLGAEPEPEQLKKVIEAQDDPEK